MPPFLKKKNEQTKKNISDPIYRIKPPLHIWCFLVSAHYLFHFILYYSQSTVVPAIVIFINKLTHQCLLSLGTGIMSDFLEYPHTFPSCFMLSLNGHLVNISLNKLFSVRLFYFVDVNSWSGFIVLLYCITYSVTCKVKHACLFKYFSNWFWDWYINVLNQ